MNSIGDTLTTRKPRCRWLRYSLRTLVLLMVVVGCGLGWLGRNVQKMRAQREAVLAIERLQGSVAREADVVEVHFGYSKLSHPDFWERMDDGLRFDRRNVTDAGLVHLRGFTQLRSLSLDNTRVTDAGLKHLRGLTQLRYLSLDNTRITDAGLEHLRGLTCLSLLYLDRTRVTGTGLKHLGGRTQLVRLSLNNTPITDAGLVHVRGLTQLLVLELHGTQVTDEGANKLQEQLPNLTIFR
jgi:hypothetical protein